MKIILEGPDNAGKTTLSHLLMKDPGLVYHHPGGRPSDFDSEVNCLQEQAAMVKNLDSFLLDRCTAISQQVYSPDASDDPDQKRTLLRKAWVKVALSNSVIFVYCRPDTDWLMSFEHFTWRDGETEEFKQEIISKQHLFIERYDELFLRIPHVHYDYRSAEAPAIVKHLGLAAKGNPASMKLVNALMTFEAPKCI